MGRLVFLLVFFTTACSSSGASWQHYRISALDEARTREMTIFLHFYEAGNSFCDKQKDELEKLIKDKAFQKVGAYRVAYGSEKALQKFFSVTQACTLLVFKGDKLKTRIASDVGPELLKVALQQGL